MSRRTDALCACGKVGYPSESRAKAAHSGTGHRLRFYECNARDGDGLWHATNDEKHRKRGQRGSAAKRARRRQESRTSRRKSRSDLKNA
jgi:hypothetical protein